MGVDHPQGRQASSPGFLNGAAADVERSRKRTRPAEAATTVSAIPNTVSC